MKKNIYTIPSIALLFLLAGCERTDPCLLDHPHGDPVKIVIDWAEQHSAIAAQGMRGNFFSLDEKPHYGVQDMPREGETIRFPKNSSLYSMVYDYYGAENIGFRNENDKDAIEAYTPQQVRATYSRSFPDENTLLEPSDLYMDIHDRFTTGSPADEIRFTPANVIETYTFEIRRVRGARYITDTRGAVSGVSGSRFLSTGKLFQNGATVLFYAEADGENDIITGSFRTFGRIDLPENVFTIEILYPSEAGFLQISWDVTGQMEEGFHIILDADIDIIPESDTGSGFDAIVDEWKDVIIPIPV